MDALSPGDSDLSIIGSPTRPEGETVTGHATLVGGEDSPVRSPNPSSWEGRSPCRPESPVEDTSREIVRATMKFRIEPWILAEDQTAHAERRCGGVETCTACRTLAALYRTQIEAVHSANLVARQLWADDSATLDAYLGANGYVIVISGFYAV